MVTADETGWRVGALSHWLWAAVTPTTTVYAICPGRGFDDAQAVLGADFDGVLVRDGWVVYRRYTHPAQPSVATGQQCSHGGIPREMQRPPKEPRRRWASTFPAYYMPVFIDESPGKRRRWFF